jgi:hypothetical protein
MRRSVSTAVALLCLVALQGLGGATVLGGPEILALMVRKIGAGDRLKVVQRLAVFTDDPGQAPTQFRETIGYVFPEKFRSDIEAPHVQRIYLVSGSSELTVVDGEIAGKPDHRFDAYKDILLYRSGPLLQDKLAKRGMDLGVSSLGRFEGRLAFVIGARYPDETATQLWVEKETFRPMRWLLAGGREEGADPALDMRYFDWRHVGRIWYPMRVEFHRGDRLLRTIHVDDMQVDPTFSDHQFDPARLLAAFGGVFPADPVRQSEREVDEIQEAIEAFNRIYK